jgi:hypothetical protein
MKQRRASILWITFSFVTWNVVFDRGVADAAIEFTREQIARYHVGAPVVAIDAAFRPRVRQAALIASLYSGLVLGFGAVALFAAGRGKGRGSRVARGDGAHAREPASDTAPKFDPSRSVRLQRSP